MSRALADMQKMQAAVMQRANAGGFNVPGSNYAGWTMGRNPASLPRELADFVQSLMGPNMPREAMAIDQPRDGAERPEPRTSQYPVGWNLLSMPGMEGLKLASFSMLRAYGDVYPVARACINVRKQEILRLGFDIVPTEPAEKAMQGDTAAQKDFQERRRTALAWWRRPDPNYRNFHSWFSAVLEDLLVIDALSLYMHPTREVGAGPFGSNLGSLDLIAGETIKPLLTARGTQPRPPNPAYQQYLYGVPRVDLMNPITDDDGQDDLGPADAQYRGDQLLYLPYTTRSWTPYGFAPTEMALMPMLIGLKRMQWQLEWFTEGTIPGVFVMPGQDVTTPAQVMALQQTLNAYAGDRAMNHRIVVLPGGSQVKDLKNPELADKSDEVIYQNVLMPFDVQPMELGIMPKVSTSQSSGAANQMAKSSQDINDRKTLKPMLMWLCRTIFDYVLQDLWGQEDMRWTWEGMDPAADMAALASVAQMEIFSGQKSIDETRIEQGEAPWGLPETSGPLIVGTGGITFLEGAIEQKQQAAAAAADALRNPKPAPGSEPAAAGDTANASSADPKAEPNRPADKVAAAYVQKVAIIAEVGELKAFARHGRDVAKFKRTFIGDALWKRITTDAGSENATTAINRALQRLNKQDSGKRAHRDAVIAALTAAAVTALGKLAKQVREEKLAPITFVDQATSTLGQGYDSAFSAGANQYDDGYEITASDAEAMASRAQAQHGFLQGFATAILAGITPAAMSQRVGSYAATMNAAYEQGYATAVVAGDPEAVATWSAAADACDLCIDRDEVEYTVETLPGWPGDGGFGDLCEGGPFCRCELNWTTGTTEE